MLNQRLTAARDIAAALATAEADIESAISSTSRLMTAIADGRRSAGVRFAMCQESLSASIEVAHALVKARAHAIDAHAALAQDRIDAGLRTVAVGDVGDCPEPSGRLSIVQSEDRTAA
jgi:hypothetical protein